MVKTFFSGLGMALTLSAAAWAQPLHNAPAPLLAAGIPAFAAVGAAAFGARLLRRHNATKK